MIDNTPYNASIIEVEPNSRAWLDCRFKFIGASEIGSVIGLNPYSNPYQVWDNKVNGKSVESNFRMQAGHYFEESVGKMIGDRVMGIHTIERDGCIRLHHNYPYIGCTLDFKGECDYGDYVLDVKCVGVNTYNKIKSYYSLPAIYYWLQIQQQLLVMSEAHVGFLAYWAAGQMLKIYKIERHLPSLDIITKASEVFWQHVMEKKEPNALLEVDGLTDYIANATKYQQDTTTVFTVMGN